MFIYSSRNAMIFFFFFTELNWHHTSIQFTFHNVPAPQAYCCLASYSTCFLHTDDVTHRWKDLACRERDWTEHSSTDLSRRPLLSSICPKRLTRQSLHEALSLCSTCIHAKLWPCKSTCSSTTRFCFAKVPNTCFPPVRSNCWFQPLDGYGEFFLHTYFLLSSRSKCPSHSTEGEEKMQTSNQNICPCTFVSGVT